MKDPFVILQCLESVVLGIVVEPAGISDNLKAFRIPLRIQEAREENLLPLQELEQVLGGISPKKGLVKAILVLQRQDYGIKMVDLPVGTDEETAGMLELQMFDLLPLDAEDILFGWERAGSSVEGKATTQVYWASVRARLSNLQSFQSPGLQITAILPDVALYKQILPLDQTCRESQFVRLSEEACEFARWGQEGKLIYSRGKQALPDASMNSIGEEGDLLHRVLYGSRNAESLLEGGSWYCGPEDRKEALLQYAIGPRPIEDANPSLSALAAKIHSLGFEIPPFLPLLSAAVLLEKTPQSLHPLGFFHSLNMIPPRLRHEQEKHLLKKLLIRNSAFLALVVLLAASNLLFFIYRAESQLINNSAEIARLAPVVKEVEAMDERVSSINDQMDYVISPTDALRKINGTLADHSQRLEGLYLSKLGYNSTGDITMEGHATNDITPWEFAELISQSGAFQISQSPKIQFKQYGSTRAIFFQLNVRAINPQTKQASNSSFLKRGE